MAFAGDLYTKGLDPFGSPQSLLHSISSQLHSRQELEELEERYAALEALEDLLEQYTIGDLVNLPDKPSESGFATPGKFLLGALTLAGLYFVTRHCGVTGECPVITEQEVLPPAIAVVGFLCDPARFQNYATLPTEFIATLSAEEIHLVRGRLNRGDILREILRQRELLAEEYARNLAIARRLASTAAAFGALRRLAPDLYDRPRVGNPLATQVRQTLSLSIRSRTPWQKEQ